MSPAFALYWPCIGPVLVLYWPRISPAVALHFPWPLLPQCHYRPKLVLIYFLYCTHDPLG